jgi:hypothetical protein
LVTVDRIIDVVWSDDRPPTVVNRLQHHIRYLRRLLGGAAATLVIAGYTGVVRRT